MANKILVQEWLKKASEDELSARVIISSGGTPGTACFLSQQVAEKALKALLLSLGKEFPRTHDLLQIASLVQKYAPELIGPISEDLLSLNRYYIETRYPGDFPEFYLDEAKESYAAAVRVMRAVAKTLEK